MITFKTQKGIEVVLTHEPCTEENEYFVKKLTELNSANHGRSIKNSLPDVHGVIWAKINNEVVGALFYDLERSKDSSGVWVVLAYVDTEFRQQGIYKELHNFLSSITKDLGRNRVVTWMNVNNQKMFQIGKSVGYKGVMVIMERRLDD
jgi:GNAT superfamily N-acetyltransferase